MFRDRTLRPHALRPPRIVAGVLAAAGALGLVGCTGGGSGSVALPTVPSTAATTTTSTVPPTTLYQPSAPQASAHAAAAHLLAAWKSGDKAGALSDATPAAVDALFAQPFPAGGVQDRSCSSPVAGPTTCTYRDYTTGNLVELSAQAVTGGWAISAAQIES